MLRYWRSTLQPRRVPEAQQHLRSGGKAVSGEVERRRRALSGEAAGFLKRVKIFHQTVRLPEVGDVAGKRILQPLGAPHQPSKILCRDIRGHIGCLKLRMDTVLSGVSVRIRADPAVVLNGRVQRL